MQLESFCRAPIVFHWAEPHRGGLVNAYTETDRMGADRWHAMYAAWQADAGGFAVVDAGSAITIDYVADSGKHLGGYILPGKQMMLRSLRQDAAQSEADSCTYILARHLRISFIRSQYFLLQFQIAILYYHYLDKVAEANSQNQYMNEMY